VRDHQIVISFWCAKMENVAKSCINDHDDKGTNYDQLLGNADKWKNNNEISSKKRKISNEKSADEETRPTRHSVRQRNRNMV